MKTYSGRIVDPMNLRPGDVSIIDICHHLSHIGRFGGATRYFYSVGQHSNLITEISCSCVDSRLHKKQKFAHDWSEAYLGDIPRPLKRLPEFEFYRATEDRVQSVIFSVFGLPDTLPPCVHEADHAILVREGIELMNHDYSKEWGKAADVDIIPQTPEQVRLAFMEIYRYLFLE